MIVHAVLVAYQNTERTLQRWTRDVRPSLEVCFKDQWRVTCVDNSAQPDDRLWSQFGDDYQWLNGENRMYGGAINWAVRRRPSDFIVYVCTNHGRMVDPRWTMDLIEPMERDPKVAMTGHLMGSNSPEGVAHWAWPDHGDRERREAFHERFRFVDGYGLGYVPQHVQGGVFAARTSALLECPYEEPFLHLYSDHLVTWSLMKAGYEVRDVCTVKSLWKDRLRNHTNLKYYHDNSEHE